MAASADARIATSLPSHPKTKKLVKRLGGASGWHLVCLFLWAAANRPDGDLEGLSDEDIELAVDWTGDDGAFVEALSAVGFLDGEQGARSIHDWAEHNPWAAGADARKEKASFAALVRQHGRAQAEHMMPDYAKRMRDARKQHEENERGHAGRNPLASNEHAGSNEVAEPVGASSTPTSRNEHCPDSVSDSDTVSDSVSVSNSDTKSQEQASQAPPTDDDPPKRGTRLPNDWQPSPELIAWARTDHPQVNLRIEVPKFRDYWHAKAGKDAAKRDWSGTFRNWIRTAAERAPRQGFTTHGDAPRQRQELTREMAR
ncbi:MAG: hypothetical protein GAK28_03204 [Luteibacter sp.]|uniref:DnaT-like ssDNA-binding domain-containing protein n=1 Tax=Luteibacter sp. TaxID=1886636 RepID=UPI0013822D5E|nr:DnaT-like ssDNA-binding domain-containing protein [Luteibacter sp.]KAF1005452.1 MAG: hypothetical protein GAK28_03204 [Luteibacter sp.]